MPLHRSTGRKQPYRHVGLETRPPAEYRGPFKSIATPVPGVQVCELMPRLARLADRYALIRSMSHSAGGHLDGMHVCLSGQSRPAADAAYIGSMVSKVRPSTRNVPSYVWVQEMEFDAGNHFHTGGFLGPAYAPLCVGKGTNNFADPEFRVTAFDPAAGMTAARMLDRRGLLGNLEHAHAGQVHATAADRLETCRAQAFDLLTGPEAPAGISTSSRNRRGCAIATAATPWAKTFWRLRRLIEAGVRLVNVHAFTGFDGVTKWPPVVNVWDMHGLVPGGVFGTSTYGLSYVLPRFDQAVAALLEDMEERGLLESTLVVAVGEFGGCAAHYHRWQGHSRTRPLPGVLLGHAGRGRYSRRHGLRRFRQDRRVPEGVPGPAGRIHGHSFARPRHSSGNPFEPRRLYSARHHRPAYFAAVPLTRS